MRLRCGPATVFVLLLVALFDTACGRYGYDPVAQRRPRTATSDVTGDGVDDLLVAGTDALESLDAVYIFAGGAMFAPTSAADAYATIVPVAGGTFHNHPVRIFDWDADGQPDVLIGGHTDAGVGRMAVVRGPISPGMHTIDSLDPMWVQFPPERDVPSHFTRGDFTGDGASDLVIAFYTSFSGMGWDGVVSVYSNTRATSAMPTAETDIDYVAAGEGFGQSLAKHSADLTGDGLPDLLVGAPGSSSGAPMGGIAYLFASPIAPGQPRANTIAFRTFTSTTVNENAYDALTTIDINLDGHDDMVAGRQFAGSSLQGAIEVYLGPIGASGGAIMLAGPRDGDELGNAMNSDADLDGDGARDLLVQAPGANGTARGALLGVLSRAAAASLRVAFIIEGDPDDVNWGRTLAAGDFNDDGRDDFVVGARHWSADRGRVRVFFGGSPRPPIAAAGDVADVTILGPATTPTGFGAIVSAF